MSSQTTPESHAPKENQSSVFKQLSPEEIRQEARRHRTELAEAKLVLRKTGDTSPLEKALEKSRQWRESLAERP